MTAIDRVCIAVNRSNPPHSNEEDGDIRGTTIDLLTRAFAAQAIDLTFVPADGPTAQAIYVAAGRADVAADFSITPRRGQWYCFSHHYGAEELQVFTMRDGPLWPGLRHFHGVLGAKADSYAQEYLIRHHRNIPLVLAETTEQVVQALRRGRVQAVVLARGTGESLFGNGKDPDVLARGAPFGATLLALAALPQNQDLLDQFNLGLEALAHARAHLGGDTVAC